MADEATPAAPDDGNLAFYASAVCGKEMPSWLGPVGRAQSVQAALFQKTIWLATPQKTSTITLINDVALLQGMTTTPTPAPEHSAYAPINQHPLQAHVL
jgi:hypothetical protein